MIVAGLAYGAWMAGWVFFAYGPQFVLCLWFGYRAAKRSGGDLLNSMAIAFLWSLLPIAGVIVMWWIWRKAGRGPRSAESADQAGAAP